MCKKANRAYREADMSDDTHCIHGAYTGSWAGPDYMCGLCEGGFTSQCPVCKRLTFKAYHYGKQVRECAGCGRDSAQLLEAIRANEDEATIDAGILQITHDSGNTHGLSATYVQSLVTRGNRAWENIAHFGEQLRKLRIKLSKHYVNRLKW